MNIERTVESLISFIINIFSLGFIYIHAQTHREMTEEDLKVRFLKNATFREWRREVKKIKWNTDPKFPGSLFTEDDNAYLHAGIYRFCQVGYLLNSYGFLMSWLYIRKQNSKNNIRKPYIK